MTYALTAWCFFWYGALLTTMPAIIRKEKGNVSDTLLWSVVVVTIIVTPILIPILVVYRIVKGK